MRAADEVAAAWGGIDVWINNAMATRVDDISPGNLFDPPAGDPGSHGRFDQRSTDSVMSSSGSFIRLMIAATAVCAGAFALGGAFAAGRSRAKPG